MELLEGEKSVISPEIDGDRILKLFAAVVHLVNQSKGGEQDEEDISDVDKLKLYGYYKHVTSGPCPPNGAPSRWRVRDYAKYQAWFGCRDMSTEMAMRRYVSLVATQDDSLSISRAAKELLEKASAERFDPDIPTPVAVLSSDESRDLSRQGNDDTERAYAMVPRGRLDISYDDLLFAAWQCCLSSSPARAKRCEEKIMCLWKEHGASETVVGVSVRSLLDLTLRVKQYPPGSQIIVSPPITVPAVLRILKMHQLTIVPVDLPRGRGLISVDCEAIENATTSKTVAIMVVHVFGMIASDQSEMKRLRELADSQGLMLLEDCAQAFGGLCETKATYTGSPYAHVSFFSFGLIKTATSLGGGVAVVRGGSSLASSMRRLLGSCYPHQSTHAYLYQVLKALMLCIVTDIPLLYRLIMSACKWLGWDFDSVATNVLRRSHSYSTEKCPVIRSRPCSALLAVLYRRLKQGGEITAMIATRRRKGLRLSLMLSNYRDISLPTFHEHIPSHAYWLQPVQASDPSDLCCYLQLRGFDAAKGVSQLICVDKECERAQRVMDKILYLPVSNLTPATIGRLERVLGTYSAGTEKVLSNATLGRFKAQSASTHTNSLFLALFVPVSIAVHIFIPTLSSLLFSFAATVVVMLFAAAWGIRISISRLYTEKSDTFAKYCYILNRPLREQVDGSEQRALLDFQLSPSRLLNEAPASIILTGTTGFIGSMLLYEILKCRRKLNVARVYIVCRGKRGEKPDSRIQRLLDQEMFSFFPSEERKLVVRVVEGDTSRPRLGLRDSDLESILHDRNVTHLFHCAASVSFTQSLYEAASANISSALYAQDIVSCLMNKKAKFVHVSTAFVHGRNSGCRESPLSESLFSLAPYDPQKIYESMLSTPYYAMKAMADHGFPNTYTFSKCVAEHILQQSLVDTVILRPCIVGPAIQRPYPGWSGSKPSTAVAGGCLYFAYQWNLWSFGNHEVPSIPVDVTCQFLLSKTFGNCEGVQIQVKDSRPDTDSSDESFEKIGSETSSYSSCERRCFQLYNAAWDCSSRRTASFTWMDYALMITHTAAVTGRFSRFTAYCGLFITAKLLPALSPNCRQFEKLHNLFVQRPFQLFLSLRRYLGRGNIPEEKLASFLDLPLLFFPFTNKTFHFQSDLVAPSDMDGQKYLSLCVAAALEFLPNDTSSSERNLRVLPLLDKNNSTRNRGIWWAFMQPRGSMLCRASAWILSYVFGWCFSKVTVDVQAFGDAIEKVIGSGGVPLQIVLAPTHRSIFDFLLVSYLCFSIPELSIAIPFIVAADDFEKLPVLGFLARRLGALFIARGKNVRDPKLAEALGELPSASSIEIFLEGTRSRDRRFLPPKTGCLRCLKESERGCAIIPVAINYEVIPEQSTLVQEATCSMSKGLSVVGLLRWLSESLRKGRPIGRVHITAASPVVMDESSPQDVGDIARTVQTKQREVTHFSRYHTEALSKVTGLEEKDIYEALLHLGGNFWPDPDHHRCAPIPENVDEVWAIALQTAPLLAPLFSTSEPMWSRWLYHLCRDEVLEDVRNKPGVLAVTRALEKLFATASHDVDNAITLLKTRGYQDLGQDHVVQIAEREGRAPITLLIPAAAMRLKGELRSDGGKTITRVSLARNASSRTVAGETLGKWGYSNSLFVVEADSHGKPCVVLKGNRYALRGKQLKKLIPFIENEIGLRIDLFREAFSDTNDISETSSQLTPDEIVALGEKVSKVSIDPADRVRSGTGHSQEDVYLARGREKMRVPDAVVWPNSESEVEAVVSIAKKHQWCLIPVGGGTNVSMATRCPPLEQEPRPVIAVDMKLLNDIFWIDEVDGVAHVGAGVTGRDLVDALAARGYTIGHEPDSYEFSTLGGWVATKASGMKKNKYGNIEDIVKAVRVVGSDGILEHGMSCGPSWGRESCGMDLCSLMMGSEGCLGIITSAFVRIWPTSVVKDYDGIILHDFETGVAFLHALSKRKDRLPASVRLMDNAHFRLGRALSPEGSSLQSLCSAALGAWMQNVSSYDMQRVVCVTILFEGDVEEVRQQKQYIRYLSRQHSGLNVGSSLGQRSYGMTFMIAYLRDFAMTYHILGESFETFVPWSKIDDVVSRTKKRILDEHTSRCLPGRPFVGSRITQVYHEGVCLYTYLSMSCDGVPGASHVFAELEMAARDEVLRCGGSLSHHHGVGKLRAPFMKQIDSVPWQNTKMAIKRAMDPENIFGARNGAFAHNFHDGNAGSASDTPNTEDN